MLTYITLLRIDALIITCQNLRWIKIVNRVLFTEVMISRLYKCAFFKESSQVIHNRFDLHVPVIVSQQKRCFFDCFYSQPVGLCLFWSTPRTVCHRYSFISADVAHRSQFFPIQELTSFHSSIARERRGSFACDIRNPLRFEVNAYRLCWQSVFVFRKLTRDSTKYM